MQAREYNEPSASALQQSELIPPVPMFEVGSAIQFGDPVQYGTIKRIEEDLTLNTEVAEVEMVSYFLIIASFIIAYIIMSVLCGNIEFSSL